MRLPDHDAVGIAEGRAQPRVDNIVPAGGDLRALAGKGVRTGILFGPERAGLTNDDLSLADEIVITATPELANLRNAKNLIDKLAELRPNDAKPKLVMNQVGVPKRPEISVADFVKPLDIQPAAIIPFDPAIFGMASNNGQMIAEADPKSQIGQSFEFIAQLVTGKAELKVEKKGGLGLLSKLKLGKKKSA